MGKTARMTVAQPTIHLLGAQHSGSDGVEQKARATYEEHKARQRLFLTPPRVP